MPRKKKVHDKVCDLCDREFQVTDSRRKRCDWCMKNNTAKHRNVSRAASRPKMFVSIDGEGRQEGDVMHLVTLSLGREDGTSATHVVGPEGTRGALKWLIDQVSGHYTAADGTKYKQVPVAFHFGWDSAVLTKDFDPRSMFLIRKVQKEPTTGLCGTNHKPGHACELLESSRLAAHLKQAREELQETTQQDITSTERELTGVLHRFDSDDVAKTITNGGEGDVIAYDRESNLAFALTPGRRFYLEHRPNGDRYEGWRRVDVHDTGSAFVGGLLKVISDWNPELTEAQKAIIEWGKQRRTETFELDEIDKIIEYSEAECVAHARVCRILLNLIKDAAHVTIQERELFGSGAIAGAALKYYKAPSRYGRGQIPGSDLSFEEIGQMTYFGGMIETPVVGLIKGMVDEVDINSAYPHKMTMMPCMREGCGTWCEGTALPPEDVLIGHVEAKWFIEEGVTSTPPFIVRRKGGRVGMPRMMDKPTWVPMVECRAAVERFGLWDTKAQTGIRVLKVLYWEPDCQCENSHPFKFQQDLYNARLEYKSKMKGVEKGSPEWWNLSCKEKAIKLVINSIYGKLAQQDPMPGKYTNLHLASYITGATRAQVRRETWAREDQGGTVVYQHTDSVLSIGGNPQDGGKALGAWGMEKQSKDFLIVQPGLATALGGGKQASRGCRLGAFKDAVEEWLKVVDLTQHPVTWPKLRTEQTVMISRRQAMAWGKPHLAGSFQPKITEISAISPKRDIEYAHQMPDNPTAWVVPPLDYIEDPATLDDVLRMRGFHRKQREQGEYDN